MEGKIHSIESFGAADGPGIRFVIFLEGCPMRCKYCHNPDTWAKSTGDTMTAQELIQKAVRYRSYWKNEGGITVSGGEPLIQIDFVTELFKMAHENDINTVLDTSGQPFQRKEPFFSKFIELMKYTDLVMLDIKEINANRHRILTGFGNENILDMAGYLSEIGKPIWIRHVLVPGYTDNDEDLQKLSSFISTLKSLEKTEVLPYHTLGAYKWKALGMEYPLDGTDPPSRERIANAERILHIK